MEWNTFSILNSTCSQAIDIFHLQLYNNYLNIVRNLYCTNTQSSQ